MVLVVSTLMPLRASLVGDRVVIAVVSAVAGPAEKARSARVHLDTGNAYFNLEKYREAIGEFEQSYLEKQDPGTFFNIGECHRLLGNNAEAIRFLRRFLQETNNHPNRVKAEDHLADLEGAAAALPPVVVPAPAARPTTSPPPGSAVPGTGAPQGSFPPASSPLRQPAPGVPAAPAETAAPALAPGALAISASPAPAQSSTPVYKKWWFWTLIGVAVAGGVVAGVVAMSTPSRPGCPAGVVCQ